MAATDKTAQEYRVRYDQMNSDKGPWNVLFQRLAEVFMTRKSNFTRTITPGEFLGEDLYDNSGQFAAMLCASVLFSLTWPDTSRAFRIKPVRKLMNIPGIEELFRFWNEEIQAAFDNPRAGFRTNAAEFFNEYVVFGTSGLGVFEGPEDDNSLPLVFSSWAIKGLCISENAQGFVDTIFYEEERTTAQAVEEYGLDNVHENVAKNYRDGKYLEKVRVLKVIEPRKFTAKDLTADGVKKEGVFSLPYRSLYLDITNNKIMRESGFHEFPVAVGRMFKMVNEVFGRSCGMLALPDAETLNAVTEGIVKATEKQLDPPLAVLDDGRLGGGVVDTSAGGLTVFNASGRLTGDKVVFPIYTVGEMQSAKDLQEVYKGSLTQAFFLDRLLDFNNQVQMTAYETSIRNKMRGESLSSIFARLETENYTPLVERAFNILFRRGMLGVVHQNLADKLKTLWDKILGRETVVIPEQVVAAIEAGLDVFEVEYISPAKRFMQSEKLQGYLNVADYLANAGAAIPGVLDVVDEDKLTRGIATYNGVGEEILRTKSEVTVLRAAKAKQAEQANQIAAGKEVSEVVRNMAQAKATVAGPGQK